ncbi:Hypp8673 [Branchiostoma lanceolatum]|uniref:Hypp8673 protein n=1 Tax=Branchiostoma lanceolatum TaxID=7740 RepID=A0A8J9Z8D2_BRALA|nr:Hypp8673 [Branchiostoma lanceolatum]
MSACVKGSPSIKGHGVLEEEDTYVAGNEPERTNSTASPPDITNKHHHNAENDDNPIPAPDVYVVSDKINAEDSAMYTASEENEESNPKAGNIDEEEKVKQAAGSTATINLNSNSNAKKSQPDTTEGSVNNIETWHDDDFIDDVDIEPYAVADMCDHETYYGTAASTAPQKTGLSGIGGSNSDAKEAQNAHNKQMINPMEANVCQQASDDSTKDTGEHKLQNPSNPAELHPNLQYSGANGDQQAQAIAIGLLTAVYGSNQDIQRANSKNMQGSNVAEPSSTTSTIAVTTSSHGTNKTIIEGIDGTSNPQSTIASMTHPSFGALMASHSTFAKLIVRTHPSTKAKLGQSPYQCKA